MITTKELIRELRHGAVEDTLLNDEAVDRLEHYHDVVDKLIKAKGRFNTEQAYKKLEDLINHYNR